MNKKETRFIQALREQILAQLFIQSTNPPSSEEWQDASKELARLGKLLNVELRHTPSNIRSANARIKTGNRY